MLSLYIGSHKQNLGMPATVPALADIDGLLEDHIRELLVEVSGSTGIGVGSLRSVLDRLVDQLWQTRRSGVDRLDLVKLLLIGRVCTTLCWSTSCGLLPPWRIPPFLHC